MKGSNITESIIEQATLDWFRELGYTILFGPDISSVGAIHELPLHSYERTSYNDVILAGRVRAALTSINPTIPQEAIDDAYRKIVRAYGNTPPLIENNRLFHKMPTDGVDVEYTDDTGRIAV